tara:strand:+ start:789 stop:1187 length:399 start_codon:yes stop_codon:yes gene_type:complete
MLFDNLNKEKEMLKDKLNALLEEIEVTDNRVEFLEKENKELQALVDEGFNSFNTNTHCLIERDKLEDLINTIEDISTCGVEDNISQARSYCEEVEYSIGNIEGERDVAVRLIQRILKDTEVVEEATEEDETK